MARSRMSRAESPTVVAINLRTSGHDGPTGRPSCWNRRGPSIPAAMLAVHHPRIAACLKKARRALALVATDTRPQACFPWAARNASTSSRETSSSERFCSPSQRKNFSTCQF